MPRFFVPSADFDGDTVRITGDDARHIARSLRMAVGETVTVCDMHGTTHTCVLEKITDDGSTARIVESVPSDTEPPHPITLYQAFPKGDKMDVIVQKAVESGACAIVLLRGGRHVVAARGAFGGGRGRRAVGLARHRQRGRLLRRRGGGSRRAGLSHVRARPTDPALRERVRLCAGLSRLRI